MLRTPGDLHTFAARVGVGGDSTSAAAVKAARALRAVCEDAFRDGECAGLQRAAQAAYAAGTLRPGGWVWSDEPMSVVHRLAHAATQLLRATTWIASAVATTALGLYLDRSKNRSRQVVLDGGLRHERQEAALHREAPLQAHLTGGAAADWPCKRSSVPASMPRAQRSQSPATIASAITKFVPAAPSGTSIGTIPAR